MSICFEQIIVEDRDEIRLITLNRPDKLNAWTSQMHAELVEAMARVRSSAENAPRSVQFTKQLLTDNGAEPDLDLVQRRELTALNEADGTAEHRDAVAAFMERRESRFR